MIWQFLVEPKSNVRFAAEVPLESTSAGGTLQISSRSTYHQAPYSNSQEKGWEIEHWVSKTAQVLALLFPAGQLPIELFRRNRRVRSKSARVELVLITGADGEIVDLARW
jgi:hypothetical protein